MHAIACKNISIASESQKRQYDQMFNNNSYSPGGIDFNPTIKRRWKGPFVVLRKINDITYQTQQGRRFKPKIFHHDRLNVTKAILTHNTEHSKVVKTASCLLFYLRNVLLYFQWLCVNVRMWSLTSKILHVGMLKRNIHILCMSLRNADAFH